MGYEVVGLLGRGSTSVVELTVDDSGRVVARKRVPLAGSMIEIDLARRRLRREAEILSALDHPGLMQILGVEDDGTDIVVVMPAMVRSLTDRVRLEGPLAGDEVVRIGRDLLDALAAAHRGGVVHRDIKPGNVLFDDQTNPVLADFGVAVTRDMTLGLTATGLVVGTAAFMAPEQAQGAVSSAASDVFSLAATLLFALTGQGPWGAGEPTVVMRRAARGRLRALPPEVPPALRRPLAAMLDPHPARRPSAAAVLGGLTGTDTQAPAPGRRLLAVATRVRSSRRGVRRLGAGRPGSAGGGPRLGAAEAGRRPSRRPHALVVVALALGLAVGGFAMVESFGHGGQTQRRVSSSQVAAACTPLAYQPCGQPQPAPHTDGSACLPGWFDVDADPTNGCEARSDYTPGIELTSGTRVTANLVPAGATDAYRTWVHGNALDLGWGKLKVTLTAPPGVTDRIEVLSEGEVLASALSSSGQPGTAVVAKPSWLGADSEWLTVRVSGVSGASAADFSLSRNSGW